MRTSGLGSARIDPFSNQRHGLAPKQNVSMKSKLQIIPRSLFSWDFRVLEGGVERAVIDKSWLRERGTFTIDGKTYTIARTSVWRGTFTLAHNGQVLAKAVKPSAFFRSFEITAGGDAYTLRAASPFLRRFLLLRRERVLGEIEPVSLFRREAVARLPEEMTAPIQLFVVFLVLVLWRRAARNNS